MIFYDGAFSHQRRRVPLISTYLPTENTLSLTEAGSPKPPIFHTLRLSFIKSRVRPRVNAGKWILRSPQTARIAEKRAMERLPESRVRKWGKFA